MTAQTKFGIKANGSYMMADQAESMVIDQGIVTQDVNFLGYQSAKSIGFFTNTKFDFLFLQTELLYASYTAEYFVTSYIDDLLSNPFVEQYNNLDVQIIAGLNKNNFKFGVGPIFHKSIDFQSDFETAPNYTGRKKGLTYGFQGIVGYEFGAFHIDLKYASDFNRVGGHLAFNEERTKFNSSISSLSIGVGLGF